MTESFRGGTRIWTVTSIQTIHSFFSQVPHLIVSPLLEICLQTPSDSHSLSPSKAITGAMKSQTHSPFFVPDLHSEMWIKRLIRGRSLEEKMSQKARCVRGRQLEPNSHAAPSNTLHQKSSLSHITASLPHLQVTS